MTTSTTDLDLARRLAEAVLSDGTLRWPELSIVGCPCLEQPTLISVYQMCQVCHLSVRWPDVNQHGVGCENCQGTNRVPNVTLETMLVVVMGGGFHADFFTNAGDGRVWLTVSPVIPPRNKPRWHFTWTDQGYSGTDAKAALMAAMGVWRTVLEEAP